MKNSWIKEDGKVYEVGRIHAEYALNAFKNDPEYKKYHALLVETGGFSNSSDGMLETAIEYALFKKGWIRLQEITVYKNNLTVGALGIHIGNLCIAPKAFYAVQKLLKDAEAIIIDVSNSMLPEDENLATREQNFTFASSQLSQVTALLRKHMRKNKIESMEITEAAIKDQLYHSTSIFAAVSILTDGKFRLRPTVSTKTDNLLNEAKFFISFSREKANDFLRRSLTSGMVTFVLDRDKLLQGRKKTTPVDYWGQRGKPGHGLGNAEAEERLTQDSPFLEFKTKPFIDSIHVYMGDYLRDKEVSKYDIRALNTFKMLTSLKFLAKPYGIKIYVYENKTAFVMQMTQKAVNSGVVAQSYKRLIEQLYPKAKIEIDNPGGEWLASKQKEAKIDATKPDALYQKKLRGAVTATIKSIELPINFLKSVNISGANNEKPAPGNPKYDALVSSVGKLGNAFNSKKHPILIRVNMDGKPFIMDGNTRYAYAQNFNEPFIWAEIQWVNGGEEAKDSTFSPANVQKAAVDSMREWINYRSSSRNERKTKSFERISFIIQLLLTDNYAKLSKDAKRFLYDVIYSRGWRSDITHSLQSDLHNANKSLGGVYGRAVVRLVTIMNKKKIGNVAALFDYIHDKWEPIKKAHSKKAQERYNKYQARKTVASTEPYGYLIDRDGNVIETDDHEEASRAWIIKHGLQRDATFVKNLLPREYFVYGANGLRLATAGNTAFIEIAKDGLAKKAYLALEKLLKEKYFESYQLEIAAYKLPEFDETGNKTSNAQISNHSLKVFKTDKELLRVAKQNVMKNETTAISNTDWMNPKAYGYWIKPTGKVVQVYHESHFEEAQDMVAARGFSGRNDLAFQSAVIFSASVLGCVKVTTLTSYDKKTRRVWLYFGEKGLSNEAFYEVRDLLKNGGFNEYIIDLAPDIMAKANTGKGLERADFWDNRSFDNHIATDDYLEAMRFVMKHKNPNPSEIQKECWFGTGSLVDMFKSNEDKQKESEDDNKLLRDLEASAMVIDKSPRWVLERIRAPYLLVFQIKTTRSFIKPIPGWLVSNRFTNLNGFKRFYMYKYMGVMDQRRLDLETRLAVRRIARMNGFKISLGYDRVAIVTPEQFVAKEAVIKPFAIDWDSGKPLKRRNYLTKTFGDFQLSKELMQFWGITRRTKFTTKPPSYLVNYQGVATLEKAIGDKFDSLYRKQVRKIVFSIKAKYSTIIKSYDDKKSAVGALERVLDIIQQEACMNGVKYDAEREYHKNKKFRDRIFRRNFTTLEALIYNQLIDRLSIEPEIKKAVFGE